MVQKKTVSKPGFCVVCKNDAFQCAFITESGQYAPGRITEMKRHRESDEVFVLLKGKATLVTADPSRKRYVTTVIESGPSYCVEAGTWHYLAVSEDAMLFVTENSAVSSENTDVISIVEENITVEV